MHGYVYIIIRNNHYNFSNEDIEEIASDVFLAVWKNQDKLERNKEIAPYIAGITKKLVIKKQRKMNNYNDNIEDYQNSLHENINIHIQTEENEKLSIVTSQLLKMKKEDKNIFLYYYYHSKKIGDIATILNISTIKVKSRLSRIRKKLKKELEKRGYSYNGK